MSIKTLSNYHLLEQLHLFTQKIKRIGNPKVTKFFKYKLVGLLKKVNLDTKFNDTSGILRKDALTAISQLCTAITWQQLLFNVQSIKLLACMILIALLFNGVISINISIILFVALGASILSSHITTAKNELANSGNKCSLFTKFKCVTIWAISRSFRDAALVYKETPSALDQSLYQKIRNLTIACPVIRENHSFKALSTYMTGIGITSVINPLCNYSTPVLLLASLVLCGFLPLMMSNTKSDYKFSIGEGKEVMKRLRFNPHKHYIDDTSTIFIPITDTPLAIQDVNSTEITEPNFTPKAITNSTVNDSASDTHTEINSDDEIMLGTNSTNKVLGLDSPRTSYNSQ